MKLKLTSLRRRTMSRVLSTIASNNLVDAIVTSQWEVDLDDVIAGLHELENSLDFVALLLDGGALLHVGDERVFDDLAATMEEVFDLSWKLGSKSILFTGQKNFYRVALAHHLKEQRRLLVGNLTETFRYLMVGI